MMRSAISNTSCKLCVITTTPRPRSRSRRISSSTCSVCATPSAAVGSSRMTSLEFHITAREIATDCRWPPERETTFVRTLPIVVTFRLRSTSRARCSIAREDIGDSSPARRAGLGLTSRPRNMFWTTSRLSHSARSW